MRVFFNANIKGREKNTLDQEQNMQEMDMERPILSLAGKNISSLGRAKVLPEDSPSNRRDSHGSDAQSFHIRLCS